MPGNFDRKTYLELKKAKESTGNIQTFITVYLLRAVQNKCQHFFDSQCPANVVLISFYTKAGVLTEEIEVEAKI